MNQILYYKKDKKQYLKYQILFCLFILIACISFITLFIHIYNNYTNEQFAKKLNSSYSISTLYSNSISYNIIEESTSEPFVIGIIKIDKINLNYSILSTTNNDLLDISVCRFAGPMPNEVGNLCIAGHNYVDYKLFSRLNELEIDDKITIYDLSGNSRNYQIYDIYETKPDDTSCTSQNTAGQRIVTLVTCNNINGKRLVLHAKDIS